MPFDMNLSFHTALHISTITFFHVGRSSCARNPSPLLFKITVNSWHLKSPFGFYPMLRPFVGQR